MTEENSIFGVFVEKYVSQLALGTEYHKDELHYARRIVAEIYVDAGRTLPTYFPHSPPEEVIDVDAIYCYNQVRKHKLVSEKKRNGTVLLNFNGTSSLHEFWSRLPQTIKSTFSNTQLIISNPPIYEDFMQKGVTTQNKSLLKRIFSRN